MSGGLYFPDGQTMVDLVASGAPGFVTTNGGTVGVIDPDGPCSGPNSDAGTSFAGPQVAAAAGLVKHRMINHGRTWIDYPGRLHTMMLAHGDRATNTDPGAAPPSIPGCVDGDRLRCGGDKYYGFGRLKLRFHNTYWMHTKTLRTGDDPHAVWVWSGPIGGNREILKCVMQQSESMSNKVDISRVRLTVRLFPPDPATNKCSYWPGMPLFSALVSDDSPDDKHMVAVLDADDNINGTCVELTLTPTALSSAGAVTTHTYCYVDDELDY